MLMVPILLPVPVAIVGEAAGEAGALPAPAGAALPVWAQAEIIEKTATARTERRNLLFIGSLNSLEHCSVEYGSVEYGSAEYGSAEYFPGNRLRGRTRTFLFRQLWAVLTRSSCERPPNIL